MKRKANEGVKVAPKKVKDSYSCINFQPSEYPNGENAISQEEKRNLLKSKFNTACDTAEIT